MKIFNIGKAVTVSLAGFALMGFTVIGCCGSQTLNEEDRGDSAFITDLATVMAVAKQNAKKNGFPQPALDAYIQQERVKYEKFNKFAKETLVPHSKMLAMGRKDPDKLQAAGEQKLAEDNKSWEGHDYVGTAKLFKRDTKTAAEEYLKALESAPVEMKGWYQYMLGITAQMGQAQDKAVEWMDKAIADNNNWMAIKGARLNKAAIYLSSKSFDKAADSLELYFAMAIPAEKKVVAEGPICKMLISAGKKVDGCTVK